MKNITSNTFPKEVKMKHSIYNTVLNLTNSHGLIYNAYTNSFIIVRKKMYESFLTEPINLLKDKFPHFYNQLKEAGCIVNNGTNETDLLQKRMNDVNNNESNYKLTINPTINCNFKCWYCYENHLSQSKMNPNVLESVKKHIYNVIQTLHPKIFNMGFFGGEPLLYYKDIVRPLLKYLKQICEITGIKTSIGITSNGYLLTDKMIEELKQLNVSSFQITLDGNKESHNKVRYPYVGADTYTKIVENIKTLLHAEILVVLRINYTSQNIIGTELIPLEFKDLTENEKKNLQIDFQRVWQDIHDESSILNEEKLEKSIKAFEDINVVVARQILNQVWSPCYADYKSQAVINFNGDVFKCTARDFTKENRLGILNEDGTITWDEEKMKQREGVRLSKEVCQRCRIAPICGGTCTQRGLDSGDSNQCIRGLDESGKDKIVLNQFYYNIVKNEISI